MNKYINTKLIEQNLHREEHGTPDERWIPESEIALFIDSVPSADVEEVVRCEECKHYEGKRGGCHNPRFGDGHANYPPPCVREDFFCADGERKETNE